MATSGTKSAKVTNYDTLEFIWTSRTPDIVNNQTIVDWKLDLVATGAGLIQTSQTRPWSVVVNGSTYGGNVSVAIGNNTRKTLASGSTTIKHNNDGTKVFSFSFSQSFSGITFGGVKLGTVSSNGSGTLPNIPRQSTLSASNGTLGTAQSLTIARNAASYTHTITYKCGTATGTIATKTTAVSVSFTPALSLALQNKTGTSVSIELTLETFNGTTSIGKNVKTITCAIPESVKPSLSIALSDPTGNLTKYGGYLKTKSTVKVVLTATENQGAAIQSYSTTVDGKTYTEQTVTSAILNTSGTLTVKATVTDARGRTATATQTITVLDYFVPKITDLRLNRCNADGTYNIKGAYLKVTFSAEISSINSKNTAAYTVKYKKNAATTYTSATITAQAGKYKVVNGTYVFAADIASGYDVILVATDAVAKPTEKAANGGTESKLLSFFYDKLGLAIGKVVELVGYVDINLKTMFRKTAEFKDTAYFEAEIVDRFKTVIGNGLVKYASEGIDPNTTLEHAIVTHINTPMGTGAYMYIVTWFYGSKSATSNRMQTAFPYNSNGSEYHRYFVNGAWTAWRRHTNADENPKLLASASYFMNQNQSVTLSEPISKQKNGIILVWSSYDTATNTVSNNHIVEHFVSKSMVSLMPDKQHLFNMFSEEFHIVSSKNLIINDTTIKGTVGNGSSGTRNGITYNNNKYVLIRVYGI